MPIPFNHYAQRTETVARAEEKQTADVAVLDSSQEFERLETPRSPLGCLTVLNAAPLGIGYWGGGGFSSRKHSCHSYCMETGFAWEVLCSTPENHVPRRYSMVCIAYLYTGTIRLPNLQPNKPMCRGGNL